MSSEPIINADTFINKIIDKFHPSFKQVRVYGTNKEPLFVANDVYAIIIGRSIDDTYVNKNLSAVLSDYNTDVNDKYRKLIKQYLVIMEDKNGVKKNRKVNMLTKYGVYQIMADLKKHEIAKTFEKFIYLVLDELEQEGVVYLAKIQEGHELEMKRYQRALELVRYENTALINKNQILECDASYVQERRSTDFNPNLNFDQDDFKCGLQLYERTYGLSCQISIVNDEWLTKQLTPTVPKRPKKSKVVVYSDDDVDVPIKELASNVAPYYIESYLYRYELDFKHITPPLISGYEYTNIYVEIGSLAKTSKPKDANAQPTKVATNVKPTVTKKAWLEIFFISKDHYTKFLARLIELYPEYLVPFKSQIWNIDVATLNTVRLDVLRTLSLMVADDDRARRIEQIKNSVAGCASDMYI